MVQFLLQPYHFINIQLSKKFSPINKESQIYATKVAIFYFFLEMAIHLYCVKGNTNVHAIFYQDPCDNN